MKTNILKITLSLVIIAILGVSCKKETAAPSDTAQLSLNGAKATIPLNGTEAGGFTNSAATPSAAGWGTVGYNLTDNLVVTTGQEALFSQNFNGNISPATAFFLRYIDIPAITDVADVTLTDIAGATSISTLGSNTASVVGWYDYNPTARTIAPVVSRFAVILNAATIAAATKVLVVQLDSIVGTGTGPYNTAVDFHTKRLK